MRIIETVEINNIPSLNDNQQKKKLTTSNEDFKEKLSSFLKKKTTDKKSTKEEIDFPEEKSDEEPYSNQYLHLSDLFSFANLDDNHIHLEHSVAKSEIIDGIENLETKIFDLENLKKVSFDSEGKPLTLNKEDLIQVLNLLEDQARIAELKEIDLSSVTAEEVKEKIGFDELEADSQRLTKDLLVEYIDLLNGEDELEESLLSNRIDRRAEIYDDLDKTNIQINFRSEELILGTEAEPLDQLKEVNESDLSESATKQVSEEENKITINDILSSNISSDSILENSVKELGNQNKSSIHTVTQEDFVYELETLVVEESEAVGSKEQVTTARIQLTPEKLGKVDLQIEMQGKDLVARLVVEQKETKEWIEQQVAHLKEQLLTQEIQVKDFEVLVHQDSMHDAMMDQQENPFFKQKQKETQKRQEGRQAPNAKHHNESQVIERPLRTGAGISIFV